MNCLIFILLTFWSILLADDVNFWSNWTSWEPKYCSDSCDYVPKQTRYRFCTINILENETRMVEMDQNTCTNYQHRKNNSTTFSDVDPDVYSDVDPMIYVNESQTRKCRNKDSSFCIKEKNLTGACGTRSYVPVKNKYFGRGLAFNTPKVDKRIILGRVTKKFAWPWFVSLLYYGERLCGASLINHIWLVTSAHCVRDRDPGKWEARLGDYTRDIFPQYPHEISRQIMQVHIHPSYFQKANHSPRYDIAVLKMSQKVEFDDNVNKICLPTEDESSTLFCYVVGFGMTNYNKKSYPLTLMEAHLPKRRCHYPQKAKKSLRL